MIGERILEFADLQQLSGQAQRAAVERWARANGIAFGYNRTGIWSTVDALNAALGVVLEHSFEPRPLSPDLIV